MSILCSGDVLDEARRFLSLPQRERHASGPARRPVPSGSPEAARRLFASATPIPGTLAAIYLRSRGIADVRDLRALRISTEMFLAGTLALSMAAQLALLLGLPVSSHLIFAIIAAAGARQGSDERDIALGRAIRDEVGCNSFRPDQIDHMLFTVSGNSRPAALKKDLDGAGTERDLYVVNLQIKDHQEFIAEMYEGTLKLGDE